MKDKNYVSYFLLAFFLFPYIAFLKFFNANPVINSSELLWALQNSFLQASVASLVCVGFGFLMTMGLFSFSKKNQSRICHMVLIPQLMPVLFSVLIGFSLLNPIPMGHIAVIAIFILINLGFSVFQIAAAIQSKLGNLAVVSEVYGIGQVNFYRKVLIPLIWSDLKLNFILIFLFCLSSLSVPLVAGGGKGTNLEVLIFEKIFIDQNWDSAWVLMLLQTGFVFLISFIFLKNRSHAAIDFKTHPYLKSKVGAVALAAYLSIYIGSYIYSVINAYSAADDLQFDVKDILISSLESLKILFFILLASYGLLIVWVIDYIQKLKHNLAINLISISTVLVGFSCYILFPTDKIADLWKIPIAFSILFFPILFKVFFEKSLDQIKKQIIAAKIYGLPLKKIVFTIVFQQLQKALFFSASLLSIWSISDFAISKSLGTQTKTLGLMAENFLSSYRLDAAYIISFYILIFWLIISTGLYFLVKRFHGNSK